VFSYIIYRNQQTRKHGNGRGKRGSNGCKLEVGKDVLTAVKQPADSNSGKKLKWASH